MPDLSQFIPQIKEQSEKRRKELEGRAVVPVEKPAGRPIFFSGEVPKVFTPDPPGNPPHLTNWEKLQPSSQWWAERIPGATESPVGQAILKASEWAMGIPAVGEVFEFFLGAVETAESAIGYSYQAAFDPELRSSDSLGFLLKHVFDPIFHKPERVADQIGAYNPREQQVIAAWWAGRSTAEALQAGQAPPLATIRELAKGTLLALSPPVALGVLGEEAQQAGNIIRRGMLDLARFQRGAEGVEFGEVTLSDEERRILRTFDLEWIFDDPTSPLMIERAQNRANYTDAFLRGTYIDEYHGLPELVAMRQAILSGVNPIEVQAAYFDRLGALALEAQLDNFLFQYLFDPMWFATLTPVVEGAKFVRSAALTGRVAPEIASRLDDVARLAGKVDDLARAGRLDDLTDATADLRKAADELDLADWKRVAAAVDDIVRAAPEGEAPDARAVLRELEALKPLREAMEELRPMSRVERVVVTLTGGDPFNPPNKWATLGTPWRINPIALSAEARATELMNMIHNSLSPLLREARSFEEMIRIVKQGAAGAFGGRFGHMFVSPMGRYVQQVLKEVSRNADDLGQVIIDTAGHRQLAEFVGQVLRLDSVEVVKRALQGEDAARAMFSQFEQAVGAIQDGALLRSLREAIARGEFTWQSLFEIGQIFRPTATKIIPFTEDMLRGAIMKHAVDAAVEIGIREFGVQPRRMLQQAAAYVKSAESLMFLGLNPLYPVQNFYNGEITSFLRGGWSLLLPERWIPKGLRRVVPSIDDVWRRAKVEPARLHEGFGVAGVEHWDSLARETASAEQAALVAGREAVRTTVWPTPSGIGGWFMEQTRRVKGFRGVAASTERLQSERQVTEWYLRAMRKLRGAFSRTDDVVPGLADELRQFDGRLADVLEDAVKSAENADDVLRVLEQDNVLLNLETLLRRGSERMGLDPGRMARYIDETVHETVRRTLENLGPRPSEEAIRGGFRNIETYVQQYLDELVGAHVPQMVEEAAAKSEAEGGGAVLQLLGEISDATYSRHASHMRFLDTQIDGILRIRDPVLRNRAWKAVLSNADTGWKRHWNWSEAVMRGTKKGLARRGMDVPDTFIESYLHLREGSRSYIDLRNKLWGGFFDRLVEGKITSEADRIQAAAEIYDRLDRAYMALTDLTEAARREMDAIFMMVMPQDTGQDVQLGVQAWRETVRRMVRRDMERVLDHHQSVRGLSDEAKHIAWRQFDEQRMSTHTQISQVEELGRAMVGGDDDALNFFLQQAEALELNVAGTPEGLAGEIFRARRHRARVEVEGLDLLERSVGGEQLGSEQARQADGVAKRFMRESERLEFDELLQRPVRVDEPVEVLDFEVASATPIEQLPQPIRNELRWAARTMLDEVISGEPGSRNFRYEIGPGTGELYTISTGYPPWYGDLFQRFPSANREAIIRALEKIVSGEGDTGVWVERIKAVALERAMRGGTPGQPAADPILLRMLGRPESEVSAAVDAWRAVGYDILGEAAASRQAGLQRLRTGALSEIYKRLDAGAAQVGEAAQEVTRAIDEATGMPILPEFDRIVGRQIYIGTGLDQLWFDNGSAILRGLEDEAVRLASEPPLRFANLPAPTLAKVRRYLNHMVGEFRETRFAAIRVAEGMRDASLLNYSRTYNFDNWLNVALPFQFWYTHTILRTMLHGLDRPWVLANYFKTKLFLERAVGENQGFPQRLRGHVKIEMPFLPDELEALAGDLWVNPFRAFGLPFEQLTQPFERWQQVTTSIENRTIRRLEEMLSEGQVGEAEYQQAIAEKAGAAWERARALVQEDDRSLRFDLMDFMNLSTSPHVPISMAWNLARGTPEELNPAPHTRSLKHIATILGIDPGVYDNVWGNVRKHFGLPAFDQFEEYRVRRDLSNMLGEGVVIDGRPVTQDAILLAMATKDGPLWDAAVDRVAKVEALRWGSRMLGIPLNPYPPGEEHQRALYDEFFDSMNLRDQGDDRAMGRFFDAHPEFEARLALWKEPEEQLHDFLVDQVWNWWWDAPRLHRDEAIQQLGPLFERGFVNEDTRATDAIPLDVLTTWVHLLGGTAPGELHLSPDIAPVAFSDPILARRMQTYYDTRNATFRYSDQVWPRWQEYFRLDKGDAREAYWDANPILQLYVDWRRDFMLRNPDLIPYIEDDPERQPTFPSIGALRQAVEEQPVLRPFEWQQALGQPSYNLVIDYFNGEELPLVTRNKLDAIAAGMGLDDWRDLVERVADSLDRTAPQALPPSAVGVPTYP